MDIDQRGEYQKAGAEITVEEPAGQPWSGNKKRNAASHQHCKIGKGPPTADTLGASLTASIVAGNPDVLGRVHDGKHSAAVAALREPQAFGDR